MSDFEITRFPRHAFATLIYITVSLYFLLLSVRIVAEYLEQPLYRTSDILPDTIAVLCFPFGMLVTYILAAKDPLKYAECDFLHYLTAILLMWTSSVPFLYFQFYHTPVLLLALVGLTTFLTVWFAAFAKFSHIRSETTAACFILLGILLVPAIYARNSPSACRYPLALEFITLSMSHAASFIIQMLQVPERLGYFRQSSLSYQIMQIILAGAAINYSTHVLKAYQSDWKFEDVCDP